MKRNEQNIIENNYDNNINIIIGAPIDKDENKFNYILDLHTSTFNRFIDSIQYNLHSEVYDFIYSNKDYKKELNEFSKQFCDDSSINRDQYVLCSSNCVNNKVGIGVKCNYDNIGCKCMVCLSGKSICSNINLELKCNAVVLSSSNSLSNSTLISFCKLSYSSCFSIVSLAFQFYNVISTKVKIRRWC